MPAEERRGVVRQCHGIVKVRSVTQNFTRASRPTSLTVPPCIPRSLSNPLSISLYPSLRLSLSSTPSLYALPPPPPPPSPTTIQGRALRGDREKSKDGEREAGVSHEFLRVGPVRRHAGCSCQTGPCQSTDRPPRPGRKMFHTHSPSIRTQTLKFQGFVFPDILPSTRPDPIEDGRREISNFGASILVRPHRALAEGP